MVIEIVQNTVSCSQIRLKLQTFEERYKNDYNLLGIYFWDTLLKRLFRGKLIYMHKLRNRFFKATSNFDIIQYTVLVWNSWECASVSERQSQKLTRSNTSIKELANYTTATLIQITRPVITRVYRSLSDSSSFIRMRSRLRPA